MKKFTVAFPAVYWECVIQIDTNFVKTVEGQPSMPILEAIKQMVEFWTDWEDALDENEGDYIKTFVCQLAKRIFHIALSNNYNLFGITEEFKNEEGYCVMDGSFGIWILEADAPKIADSEFIIEKTEEVA